MRELLARAPYQGAPALAHERQAAHGGRPRTGPRGTAVASVRKRANSPSVRRGEPAPGEPPPPPARTASTSAATASTAETPMFGLSAPEGFRRLSGGSLHAVVTRYTRRGDVHIAYQSMGAGPDLLYVPTWVSQMEQLAAEPHMAAFIERLCSFARLITFDRRGSGLSDPVDGRSHAGGADRRHPGRDGRRGLRAHGAGGVAGGRAAGDHVRRQPSRARELADPVRHLRAHALGRGLPLPAAG